MSFVPLWNLTTLTKYDSDKEFAAVPKIAIKTVKATIPYSQGVDMDGEVNGVEVDENGEVYGVEVVECVDIFYRVL